MTKFQITTSQNIEFDTEDEAVAFVKTCGYENLKGNVGIALVYDGARSGKNLLCEKDKHGNLPSKKIPVSDLKKE